MGCCLATQRRNMKNIDLSPRVFCIIQLRANSVEVIMNVFRNMCSVITFLTHWGRVTHICVNKLIIIGSDNGLSPGRRQAIIWTNAGILLIGPLGTNFSEILIEILTFSFKKMHLKMPSGKWRQSCLGLNVLKLPPNLSGANELTIQLPGHHETIVLWKPFIDSHPNYTDWNQIKHTLFHYHPLSWSL